MFGLLNLYKPSGITSRAAINQVHKLIRPTKIGHTGTLDPLAHGVLVVTIGQATRLTQRVQSWPKSYCGTFLLGRTSDTEDIEGEVVELESPVEPTRDELESSLNSLTGEILQRPPAYSALKVNGKRAYNLARQGEAVELKPRPVTIHELEIVEYDYPRLILNVTCGSGTYIRSLGRDLARDVGSDAVMSDLQRTSVGPFRVDTAVKLESITAESLPTLLSPAAMATADLPSWQLDEGQLRQLGFGREISCTNLTSDEVAALTGSGELAAILERQASGLYRPVCNFAAR